MVADVGGRKRKRHSIYIVVEPEVFPDPDGDESIEQIIPLEASLRFVYEDGPRNCEAVAVDPVGGKIYLFSKAPSAEAKMYSLPLPKTISKKVQKATLVTKIAIPHATAMDISPDGRRAVILTYTSAHEFVREQNETWQEAFSRKPTPISVPLRRQGESICYGPDSRTLYLTSEQLPTPLWKVSPKKPRANSSR